SKTSANGTKGTIVRLAAKVRDADAARETPIVLDGYWNPEGCSGNGPTDKCRKDILPLKLGDGRALSDYIDDDDCFPEQEGGLTNRADPAFFCLRSAYGSTNLIERRFELSVSDDKIYSAFSLLNNLQEPAA